MPDSEVRPLAQTFNILRESKEDVFRKYKVEQVLGRGSMGNVLKVRLRQGTVALCGFCRKKRSRPTGPDHFYALKSIILDRVSPTFLRELLNEIAILRTLDHPNIVKLHEVYRHQHQIYLLLELCDGGDLYTRSPYSEREAARITAQILSAVHYMHNYGIVHRDLKYENILFENNEPGAEVKIIDFGLSKKFLGQPGNMTDRVGTLYTMSPQVLQGVYTAQADLWAVGVISYMLLSATKPFHHKRHGKMIDLIMQCHYTMEGQVWEGISDSAKDFVSRLLVIDPRKRMDGAAALKHPWIVNREKLPDEKPSEDLLRSVDGSLLRYRHSSALKKLALNVIAHRSTSAEIVALRQAFEAFDTERDGVVTFEEFKKALENLHYSEETLQKIFSSVDINRNGVIRYTEFLAATIEAHGHIAEERIAEAFDRIDSDEDGHISLENLKEVMGEHCTADEIKAVMDSGDRDKDGRISYAEFLRAFRTQTRSNISQMLIDSEALSGHSLGEGSLLGLDAKIPGGKYDLKVPSSIKE